MCAHYTSATIQGAATGDAMKFVGSRHAQMVSPITKSYKIGHREKKLSKTDTLPK